MIADTCLYFGAGFLGRLPLGTQLLNGSPGSPGSCTERPHGEWQDKPCERTLRHPSLAPRRMQTE